MRRSYDHGLPFSKILSTNLDSWKERIRNNKAALVVIDGGVGEGKTTLAVHMADYYSGYEIDLSKSHPQYAMGGVQFQEKLMICVAKKLPVIIYDEAGDFNSRGALTKFNAMLNRVFETYRTFKILVILALPSFAVLDRQLLDKRIVRGLIHCYDRKNDYGNFKGYSLYRMYYLMAHMKRLTVPSQAYSLVEPNFYGHFLDLPKERARLLDKISTEGKMEIVTENVLEAKGLVDYNYIARQLNRSVNWVRKKIKNVASKPETVFKRKAYYKKDVVQLLEAYL